MSSFGEKLKRAREGLGLSQLTLAEMVGINKDTLSRYESGANKNPGLEIVKNLAQALSMDLCDLIDDNKNVDKLYSYEEKIITKLKGIRSELDRKKIERVIDSFLAIGKR